MGVENFQNVATGAIEQRAYELWQLRGCPSGSSQQDWLAAEHELSQQFPQQPTPPKRRIRTRSLSVRRVQRSSTRLLVALVPQALRAVG